MLIRPSIDQMHNIAAYDLTAFDILEDTAWTPPYQQSLALLEWFCFTIGSICNAHDVPNVVFCTAAYQLAQLRGLGAYHLFLRYAEKVFNAV